METNPEMINGGEHWVKRQKCNNTKIRHKKGEGVTGTKQKARRCSARAAEQQKAPKRLHPMGSAASQAREAE